MYLEGAELKLYLRWALRSNPLVIYCKFYCFNVLAASY